MAYLLPYLELDSIHRNLRVRMDVRVGNPPQLVGGRWDSRAWWQYQGPNEDLQMAQVQIRTFLCPSDQASQDVNRGVFISISHHEESTGGLLFLAPNNNVPRGRTNYTGVAGANGRTASVSDPACGGANLRQYQGLLAHRTEHSLTKVADGTSNTLLFGEGLGDMDPNNPSASGRQFAWSWIGVGAISTKFGLGRGGTRPGTNQPGSHWANFSSRHPGGVNFCFADGSVRAVQFGSTTVRNPMLPPNPPTPSQDWWVLQRLAGFRDGQTVSPGEL